MLTKLACCTFTVSATITLAACTALAQWQPPNPTHTSPERSSDPMRVEIAQNQITMATHDGRTIISPNGQPILSRFDGQAQVEFLPDDQGVDIRVTLHNHTARPIEFPTIVVGGLRLGNRLNSFDFRRTTEPRVLDNGGNDRYFPAFWQYPNQVYSPVLVVGNDRHWVGASLLYSAIEYNQPTWLGIRTPGGAFNRTGLNWEIFARLEGELPPGETREYTLALRVTDAASPGDHENAWLRTLTPYRDYFQKTYGGVRYRRDPRPTRGFQLAQKMFVGSDNPHGYIGFRPDIHGWKRTADHIERAIDDNWQRGLMWAPSGLFSQEHDELNYPFLMLTPLLQRGIQASSLHELAGLPRPGFDFGYWWGRSTRVMYGWNDPRNEPLDPNNPDHRARAFAEMDLAVQLNATTIGLDAYSHISIRDQYRWLLILQDRYPSIRFVTEPWMADCFHALAPTFVTTYGRENGNILADFLIPGHETWGSIRFDLFRRDRGRELSRNEKLLEIERIARLGLVPLVFESGLALPTPIDRYNARPSWLATVPEDLQMPPVPPAESILKLFVPRENAPEQTETSRPRLVGSFTPLPAGGAQAVGPPGPRPTQTGSSVPARPVSWAFPPTRVVTTPTINPNPNASSQTTPIPYRVSTRQFDRRALAEAIRRAQRARLGEDDEPQPEPQSETIDD